MSKYREPFVGFTYILGDNIYVSGGSEFFTESEPATEYWKSFCKKPSQAKFIDLKVVRTSDGSRYNETGFPEIESRTATAPGNDGTYYFGEDFKQKPLTMELAFDDIEEKDFRRLKTVFANKTPAKLFFDEAPYKCRYVVSSGPSDIKYLCFDEEHLGKTKRIYKGEMTINFVAYYPFSVCTKKELLYANTENKEIAKYYDLDDNAWVEGSGLLEKPEDADIFVNGEAKLYNGGDRPVEWKLTFKSNGGDVVITYGDKRIELAPFKSDELITVDSKLHAVIGQDKYAQHFKNVLSEFFRIKTGESIIKVENAKDINIEYNYVYY